MSMDVQQARRIAFQIEEQAALWLARRDDSTWSEPDQEDLDSWLAQSFAHKAAFWRLEEGWRRADRVSALGLETPSKRWTNTVVSTWWKPVALAASLAFAAFLGLVHLAGNSNPDRNAQQIATAVGGHKVIQLNDGSSIELNTATLVRASVGSDNREVWLEKGEAFFDVQHSDTMPFVVHAGPKTVTVLGTKFTVRRDGDKVTVAVLKGRVRVTEAAFSQDGAATLVPAGSIAVTEDKTTLVTQDAPSSVQAEMAWRGGQLIFRNDTLAEAAAEFNRYNERKIVVEGRAGELKIGGSFQASNVDGFTRLLRDAYGLNVETSDNQIRISE